jgi:hypothetical protein
MSGIFGKINPKIFQGSIPNKSEKLPFRVFGLSLSLCVPQVQGLSLKRI